MGTERCRVIGTAKEVIILLQEISIACIDNHPPKKVVVIKVHCLLGDLMDVSYDIVLT